MERLFFLCPVTRRTVDVGVTTEIGTLPRIKSEKCAPSVPLAGRCMSGSCVMPRYRRRHDAKI
jgi:hypothetical protein